MSNDLIQFFLFGLASFCIALIVYSWVVFPFIIKTVAIYLKKSPPIALGASPVTVSVIVAAYNEELAIARKIENLLEQHYPAQHLEIIIASDGSTDHTVQIASRYKDIRILEFTKNRGRACVHNEAASIAKGDILLFTDAETLLSSDFVSRAVLYFSDTHIGCGSGNYSFRPLGGIGETESFYWRIEKIIRQNECSAGLLPFASGGCFLIRRELYTTIPPHSDIDNILPLHVIMKGFRVFYAADAEAFDVTVADLDTHFRKRIRIAQRSIGDLISYFDGLASAGKFGVLWVVFSHRILRWMTGILGFSIMLITSIAIATCEQHISCGLWLSLLSFQVSFFILMGIGWIQDRFKMKLHFIGVFSQYAYSFGVAMFAFTIAILRYLRGRKIAGYKTVISR